MVAGRNTTPFPRATVASSLVPPSQNTFALLDDDAAGTVDVYAAHTDGTPRADDAANTVDDDVSLTDGTPRAVDDTAAGPVDNDVDHTATEGDFHTDTDGTPREDGDSQPLLDLARGCTGEF